MSAPAVAARRAALADYLELTKPRITLMVMLTTMVGFVMGSAAHVRLPGLIAPRARRTRRLGAAQGRVGVALGGEAGARLLPHLGMPASPATVLRLVRRMPLPARRAPRALGVDD